jgi:dTDP-4-amino-4,6-dideoxygalactose transaminase
MDYDAVINRSVRGFEGGDFLRKIRRQPSAALLALLRRRIAGYPAQRICERRALANEALKILPRAEIPGRNNAEHTFWVFPILCEEAEALRRHLVAGGFDATRGASSMCVVPPSHAGQARAERTERDLARILYLPVYPGVTRSELDRMAKAVTEFCPNVSRPQGVAP